MRHSFTLVFRWRRRGTKDLQLCNNITKVDMCDYMFCKQRFEALQIEWDLGHTLEAFAMNRNAMLEHF